MAEDWWLPAPLPGLSQGDIIAGVAFAIVVNPLTPLVKDSDGKRAVWAPSTEWKPDNNGRGHALSAGKMGAGVVVSHSCELDKEKARGRVLLAPVPSLTNLPEEHRPVVLAQQKRSAMPLPGVPNLGDCYADLHNIMSFDRRVLDSCTRLASMTEAARRRLMLQLIEFFVRVDATSLSFKAE